MFDANVARTYIVIYSLVITAVLILFLVLAQPIGMRFDYGKQENLRLIDVILPTFLGYLGSAAHFIFSTSAPRIVPPEKSTLLKLMVHAPFWIFTMYCMSLFYAHYVTHLPISNDEMRITELDYASISRYLSLGLGMLTATTGVISSYLFGAAQPILKGEINEDAVNDRKT